MPNDLSQTVLIAGGGPTGLTAALELRRFGIPVRIIDEMEGPAATSRAVGIQARTLEEMELRGLADEFVRIGHPASGGDIYGDGKLLVHVDFTRIASRYNYLLFLSQTETDRILRVRQRLVVCRRYVVFNRFIYRAFRRAHIDKLIAHVAVGDWRCDLPRLVVLPQ